MSSEQLDSPQDHLDRMDYSGPVAALDDVRRVMVDLSDLCDRQLVIPADQATFLVRRALSLVDACLDACLDAYSLVEPPC